MNFDGRDPLCAGCCAFFADGHPPVRGVLLDREEDGPVLVTLEMIARFDVRRGSVVVQPTGERLPMFAVTMVAGTYVCANHAVPRAVTNFMGSTGRRP